MSGTDDRVAGTVSESKTEDRMLTGDKIVGPEKLQGEGGETTKAQAQVSKLHVLRAAVFMSADSMLSDLRKIRGATTIEEAQALVNLMIDRVIALSKAAENAAE